MNQDESYANIRDVDQLGQLIGQRLVDITQHDKEEFDETGQSYVMFHFENGWSVRFPIGDHGFEVDSP